MKKIYINTPHDIRNNILTSVIQPVDNTCYIEIWLELEQVGEMWSQIRNNTYNLFYMEKHISISKRILNIISRNKHNFHQ